MNPTVLMDKAARAVASAKLLLDAGDVDGACNRAYPKSFGGIWLCGYFALRVLPILTLPDEPDVVAAPVGLEKL